MLDKAWGLEATSRLSCQAKVADEDLVIEIPKYTINYEREGGGEETVKWTDTQDIAIALAEAHPDAGSEGGALHRPVQVGDGAAGLQRRPEALRREDPRGDPDGLDRRSGISAGRAVGARE